MCHSTRRLHAGRPDVIAVWGSSLWRKDSDLRSASCLLFICSLPHCLTRCSWVIASQTSSSLRGGISTAHQMGCRASSGNGQDRELVLGSGAPSLPRAESAPAVLRVLLWAACMQKETVSCPNLHGQPRASTPDFKPLHLCNIEVATPKENQARIPFPV